MIKDNGIYKWVPALGVLEQVDKLIKKSLDNTISPAEFAILQDQNLALLSSYEHARDLSIDLAVNWLTKYKFKDWDKHRSDPEKKGELVTHDEKLQRANDIVTKLVDHKFWHSHGRFISAEKLKDELGLEFENYPDNEAKKLIRDYNDLLTDFVERKLYTHYMHDKQKTGEMT